MRNRVEVIGLLLLVTGCTSVPSDCAKTTDAGEIHGELERAYAANEAAFAALDVDAVMKLRHPDFHSVDRAGKASTREETKERTRRFLERIDRFDAQRETIQDLAVHGDTAIVRVHQVLSRTQRLGDGAMHRVDTSVTQREWRRCTEEGWLLWRVDDVGDGSLLIDGKPPT